MPLPSESRAARAGSRRPYGDRRLRARGLPTMRMNSRPVRLPRGRCGYARRPPAEADNAAPFAALAASGGNCAGRAGMTASGATRSVAPGTAATLVTIAETPGSAAFVEVLPCAIGAGGDDSREVTTAGDVSSV